MFKGTIYKIVNKVNNKIYIGQTTKTAEQRLERHKKDARGGSDMALHRAMRKHGENNFKTSVLVSNINTREELNMIEEQYILKYNSFNKDIGYNVALGGYSGKNNRLLEIEDIDKIVDLLKNTNLTFNEIGSKFNISLSAVSNINTGKTWYSNRIEYPIREFKEVVRLDDYTVNNIKKLLAENKYKLSEIADIARTSLNEVSRINIGYLHYDKSLAYPIMKTNSRRKDVSDEETVINIIKDLILGYDYSYLSTKYGLNKTTISDINKGRTWRELYPGRYPIDIHGYMCKKYFGFPEEETVDLSEL